MQKISKHITLWMIGLFIVGTIVLSISAAWSGYFYQFDNDEIFHVNLLYQIAGGARPFTSFFTIYTPVFHWMLLPIYYVFGATFTTFHVLRILMIILFFVRIMLAVRLLSRVFDRVIAWVFVPLILIEPLTGFSGMQIRPDNVMLTVILFGFVMLERAITIKKDAVFFLSGLLFGLAVIFLIKSLPIVAVVVTVLGMTAIIKRKYRGVAFFIGGLILPIFLFTLYYALIGELGSMIRGVFVDPLVLFGGLLFPTNYRFYFNPDNPLFFGAVGKPSTWYYAVTLPWIAAFGAILQLLEMAKRKHYAPMVYMLIGSIIVQAIVLLNSPSVFSQYFLSLNFFLTIIAAVTIVRVYRLLEKLGAGVPMVLVSLVLFISIVRVAVPGNMTRAATNSIPLEARYTKIWQMIPAQEPTFPNFLFRPSVYPLLIGSFYGDVPTNILARFPDILSTLRSHNVKYLILSNYYISFFPNEVQEYIHENYSLTDIPEVYKRNK